MPLPHPVSITKGTILSLSSNADVYGRGEKYYRDGKVKEYNQTVDTDGAVIVTALVEGNYKNYEVTIKPDSMGSLSGYKCTCASYSIWRGACKHVVATLFCYAEGHRSTFSAEKMQLHAQNLTASLEKIIFSGIDDTLLPPAELYSSKGLYKLSPTLNCTQKGVYLTFEVGLVRMYVVKNISAFVNNFKNGETTTYGQGLTLTHRRENFCETSRRLIDFLEKEEEIHTEVGKRLSRSFQFTHSPLHAQRELALSPRSADEFFSIMQDEVLSCKSDFADSLTIKDEFPPLGIKVTFTTSDTTIKVTNPPHRMIKGKQHHYVPTPGGLYRIPAADGEVLSALLKALADVPSREIKFADDSQQRFIAVILPFLQRIGAISNIEGEAPQGSVSPVHAKIYFDADGKDVTAQLEFNYISTNSGGIVKDIVHEYAMRRRLSAYGFMQDGEQFRLKGSEQIYTFLHSPHGIAALHDNAEIYISEALQNKRINAGTPQIGLRLSGNLLNITLSDAGFEISELLEALESYRTKKRFHRLKDGRFISLEDETIAETAELLDKLDATKKEVKDNTLSLPAYRAFYADELAQSATLPFQRDKALEKLLNSFNEPTKIKIPRGLAKILREYQKTGFRWLKTLASYGFGGILADDMGLGKTLQIIALLASDRGGPSIVVVPSSVLYNWQNEIRRFAPQLTAQIICGTPEKRHELLKTPNIDVFITTYDCLKRDIDFYNDIEFSYIIADEAQNIKNPATQAAKSVKQLRGGIRFALTGTPIENTLTELWSIFDFIMPGYLYNAAKFSRLYETPIIKHNNPETSKKLRKQISPFVLRRIKKSVLTELPDKTETTLQAELTPEQNKIYQAYLLQAIGVLDGYSDINKNKIAILAQLTRLRQICCHPSLFLQGYNGDSGKLDLTMETIQIALDSGHRVLLFSQFTQMLDIIKNALTSTDIKYFYLDGATKAQERTEMTEKFNDGERDIFLISLKAGGTGLNLTGADVVIHYDQWWNPSVMEQASDRAHRYGQEKAVQIFNIVAKDTIEEKIIDLQNRKRNLIDSVITEGGSFINALTEEDIRELFVHGGIT